MAAEKLIFDKFEVTVDAEKLRFDEDSLNTYIQTEAGYYDNFGAFLALAERNLQNKENMHEKLFSERFVEAKDDGDSDKKAEAKAKADSVVALVKDQIVEAKYIVNRLKNHLKAWDKNHDNAMSLGHMLRKQMDKYSNDSIMGNPGYSYHSSRIDDNQIEATVKSFEESAQESKDSSFSDTLTADNLF